MSSATNIYAKVIHRRSITGLLICLTSCSVAAADNPQPPANAAPAEDGNWSMQGKNYASTRFSGLDQINAQNVGKLSVQFTFSTGVNRGHEAAPIVVGDTMYIVTPYPNYVYALDLTQPGAPTKWKYEPKPVASAQGVACCDVVNRGAQYLDGQIIFSTLDGQVIALDAGTGNEHWRAQLANINKGESITMAPLVVKDKVLVGNSGGEFGVRGWLIALDARSGKEVWRAYSTGPDAEVLIGPEFKPFYSSDRGKDLGVTSWPPEAWKIGGGTVWGWLSYDPDLNVVYHGTANPGPWNPDQRPGDNKWTGGIFARDLDSGAARWFYQSVPHDLYDYDGINELVLLDMQINGQQRRVVVRPERNGYLYVIDRTTGEVLSADAYANVNSITKVDLKTGRPTYNPEKKPQINKVVRDICPTAPGAKDWNPSAYSPRTGLLYVPHLNLCMDWESVETNYIAGTPYVGANTVMHPGQGGHRGVFTAWNIAERKPQWEIKEDLPLWSGALATAGDLVFYGTLDGFFKAVDARTGEVKWQFKTGSGIIGQPISYRGPDGRQYIAVLSGVGGWAGAIVAADLDPRDPTAAKGMVNAVSDLPQKTTKGGMLYVFALPQN
ncbi:MAG: methanol/ethanol family PQQ-dependent dehydrogenase [Povalibacter sp.]